MRSLCRDIKLENTLLDASKRLVKITDFGYAKGQEDSVPISNVGTPNYAGMPVPRLLYKDVLYKHTHNIITKFSGPSNLCLCSS